MCARMPPPLFGMIRFQLPATVVLACLLVWPLAGRAQVEIEFGE